MDGWRGGFVDETKSLLIRMDVRVEISRPTPLGYWWPEELMGLLIEKDVRAHSLPFHLSEMGNMGDHPWHNPGFVEAFDDSPSLAMIYS